MKPEVLLFQGTSHDPYWYNRAAGPYKLATYLQKVSCKAQVIPNCTALTRRGYEQVFKKYASENLVWIGFTTNWLAGRRDQNYYDQWYTSSDMIIDSGITEWYHTAVDDRETVYSCIYEPEIFRIILETARKYNPDCQIVFGGSQLDRNEYFHPTILMPEAHYIKGNAELPVAHMHKRFRKKNFSLVDLPANTEYDYGMFRKSFISWQNDDHVSPEEWLPIEISRGCAFKCKFCNYDMKDTRDNYVDAVSLRKHVLRLHKKYGTTKFTIMDDLYNDNYDKVQDLYENCWSKLPFQPELGGYLRLDLLWKRPDQAQMLYDSGFRCGSFGIETLNDKAGKAVGKGLGRKRIIETLEMLKEVWQDRVLIHAFFIAGLPHEDEESLLATVEWTKDTNLIHSTIWHWLELENTKLLPPDTNVNKISVLGKEPTKYGYTFETDRDLQEKQSVVRNLSSKKIIDIIKYEDYLKMEESWAKIDAELFQYNTDWVNNAGVTLSYAKFINNIGNKVSLNTYFTIYADKRATGQSHEQIVTETINNMGQAHLVWENSVKKHKTIERLLKIID